MDRRGTPVPTTLSLLKLDEAEYYRQPRIFPFARLFMKMEEPTLSASQSRTEFSVRLIFML